MKQTTYQPYSRSHQDAYQMESTNHAGVTDMPSFYAAVERLEAELRTYKEGVDKISALQDRTLGSIADSQVQNELDSIIEQTRQTAQRLRNGIKELQALGSDSREGQIRAKRANILKEQFLQALDRYRQVEQRFKSAQRTQMEHQIRIVKPNATNEEIRAVIDDNAGGQIFQQALLNNDQLGRARSAYREVQARHDDIVRINQTVMELQQLMNDMVLMVEQDQNKISVIEKTAAQVRDETERGLNDTAEARQHALKARQKRIICFSIAVAILLIIALAVGLKFGLNNH